MELQLSMRNVAFVTFKKIVDTKLDNIIITLFISETRSLIIY